MLDLGSGSRRLLFQQLLKARKRLDEDVLRLMEYNAIDSDAAEVCCLAGALAAHSEDDVRWSKADLELQIYNNDFVISFHISFCALNAILAVVVEHMSNTTLSQTVEMVSGVYQPVLFIATIPK